MTEQRKSNVDKLSDVLYSRTKYKDPLDSRAEVKSHDDAQDVAQGWQSPSIDDILKREKKDEKITPFMKKFFIFSLIFFIIALGVATFVFFGGSNFISSKNVDINAVGPTNVSAGEVVELEVVIKNGNNANLELANFSVQYPAGARDPLDSGKPLNIVKESLGEIRAGDSFVKNIKFYLIGAVGETKDLKLSLEYKVRGSNATFFKEKIYTIIIGNSPILLEVSSPKSVTSSELFKTKVTVTHEGSDILKNVMFKVEYPYGFTPIKVAPATVAENNVWALGDMSSGAKKDIEIEGFLMGEDGENRTFRFYAGVSENGSANPNFKTIITSRQETVAVNRPSIGLVMSLNGDIEDVYVAPAQRLINANARFQNNLPVKLINPKLNIKLTGVALNETSIKANLGGFYNSLTDIVSWNITNSNGLSELSPGENGSVSLSFESVPESLLSRNREINLDITLTGSVLGSRDLISVSDKKTIKISSEVSFNAKALYSIGPFKNTGPIPPIAEKESTYTIVLSVGNTQSEITNSKITARLGPAVRWISAYSEQSEDIQFDEATNMVTWNISRIQADTGFNSPEREAVFQVALTPSISQVGLTPILVSNINLTGVDSFTNRNISINLNPVTTKLINDPSFIQGDEVVKK